MLHLQELSALHTSKTSMAVAFQDDEFTKICKELEDPQVDGWEFFVESHGVTIYRLYDEVGCHCHFVQPPALMLSRIPATLT